MPLHQPSNSAPPPSSLWSLLTPFIPLHSKYYACTWLLILIFYFFLFKSRNVFSLYLPQCLNKTFCNLFVYWMNKNTSISDIQPVHTLSIKTFNSMSANLAIFWALNLLYQVLFWATVDHRDQLLCTILPLYHRKLWKTLFFKDMSQHFSDSCFMVYWKGYCSYEIV